MYTEEQVNQYLERIGFSGPIMHNKATLDELIYLHQCSIPFETVTLHRTGEIPNLDLDAIWDKIMVRGLGGYCFELNKLFEYLLRSLGFDTRPVLCRAVRGRPGRLPIQHRGMIVYVEEGACCADVGFGGPMPAGALLLAHGVEQEVRGETFITVKTDHAWWKIERITRGKFDNFDDAVEERRQIELELCTASCEEVDFEALNLAAGQPGTLFRDVELMNLRTATGHHSLREGILKIKSNGETEVFELKTEDEVNEAAEKYFGLKF